MARISPGGSGKNPGFFLEPKRSREVVVKCCTFITYVSSITMLMLLIILPAIFLFAVTALFTARFIRFAHKNDIIDRPNGRSSHTVPTPRGGGIGFAMFSLIGFVVAILYLGIVTTETMFFLLALTGIAVSGWFDDRYNLSRRLRFGVQSFFAVVMLFAFGSVSSIYVPGLESVHVGYFGWLIGFLWITGLCNVYNFMDGIDGIASVQAIIASLGWLVMGIVLSNPLIIGLNLIIFSTVLAFLLFNWAPAKVFMGDAGSLFLGLFFAGMPFLASWISGQITIGLALWFSFFLLFPFLLDGSYTILRRYFEGENIFDAHRSHLYQRLNITGWSESRIVLMYGVMSLFGICLMLLFWHGSAWDKIFAAMVAFSLMGFVDLYVTRTEVAAEKHA